VIRVLPVNDPPYITINNSRIEISTTLSVSVVSIVGVSVGDPDAGSKSIQLRILVPEGTGALNFTAEGTLTKSMQGQRMHSLTCSFLPSFLPSFIHSFIHSFISFLEFHHTHAPFRSVPFSSSSFFVLFSLSHF
jgi:hypothetical protein